MNANILESTSCAREERKVPRKNIEGMTRGKAGDNIKIWTRRSERKRKQEKNTGMEDEPKEVNLKRRVNEEEKEFKGESNRRRKRKEYE